MGVMLPVTWVTVPVRDPTLGGGDTAGTGITAGMTMAIREPWGRGPL